MTDASERVFDAGLQAERTEMAWRRTALAVAVGAVGGTRLAVPHLGYAAVLIGSVGLLLAVVVSGVARRRYRAIHRSLTAHGDLTSVRSAGVPIVGLVLGSVALGVLALGFVIGRAA